MIDADRRLSPEEITHSEKKFTERICSERTRPFCRLGIALAGFFLWVIVQGRLSQLLGFIDGEILNIAISGFIALPVLLLFWRLVPAAARKLCVQNGRIVAAVAFILFCPFLVIAFMYGLEYTGLTTGWFLFAAVLLMLATTEEVVCRGFMLDVLSFRGNRTVGLLLSSSVFAFLHVHNDCASIPGIFNIFLAGVLFGLLRFLTNGLVYPVLLHWLWNLITGMVFGWSVSGYTILPSLFRSVVQPPWGSFGPEESLIMTVAVAGCLIILWKQISSPEKDTLSAISEP